MNSFYNSDNLDNLDKGLDSDDAEIYDSIPNVGSMSINDKILYYPYKSEPIYDLYVRNSLEIIENKLNFPACFFGYAKYKSYNLDFLTLSEEDNAILAEMKAIKEVREDEENDENINGILEAPDISNEEYNIKIKQRDEFVTKEDIFAIKRYNLRSCYNMYDDIDPNNDQNEDSLITKDFITNYYDRDMMKWYRNLGTALSTQTQPTQEKLEILKDNQQYDAVISNCYTDFTTKNKYSFHYYPLEIIKIIGYDINNLSISISYPDLVTKIYDAIGWCEDKKEEISYKYNIKSTNKSLSEQKESDQLKYINKIIEAQYGLKIKRINNSIYKDNITFRLEDSKNWDNLPDKINYTEEEFEDEENLLNLKRKIVPIELKIKRMTKSNNFDTSNLDVFIDDFDE
jgi:hypothetical protein